MNKTDIEWADMTWNPVVGCEHNCEYCYARRIAKRFGGYDKGDGTITTHNPLPRAELHQPLTITRSSGKTVKSPFPFGFEPTLLCYRLEEPQHIKEPQTIFVCSMADLFGRWVPTRWIVEVLDACAAAPQHRYMFLTKNRRDTRSSTRWRCFPARITSGTAAPSPECTTNDLMAR